MIIWSDVATHVHNNLDIKPFKYTYEKPEVEKTFLIIWTLLMIFRRIYKSRLDSN